MDPDRCGQWRQFYTDLSCAVESEYLMHSSSEKSTKTTLSHIKIRSYSVAEIS